MIRLHAIGFLMLHGLITGAQSSGLLAGNAHGIANPGFVRWWFTRLGESWLLSRFGLESRPILFLTGLLWLAAGVGFVAAGMSLAGWLVPTAWYPTLAAGSALISLVLVVLFFHPIYLAALAINAHVYMAAAGGLNLQEG
ncbi:MAG TPA: hypothetical protein VD902_10965 [Symbiobacteriaceae bacterium]|nr:hypothetical protein [Symbiobacteriaceae bacterium]